jgi:5-methylcytosine-specific restriction endonuclease McrA
MSDQPEHLNKTAPWRSWYGQRRWRRRARAQLISEPWCKLCADHGIAKAAFAADHVTPHRGDYWQFHTAPLQSLCKDCHDSAKRFEESRGFTPGCGLDGFPLDPRHPAYR